jgi:hypothetical protein
VGYRGGDGETWDLVSHATKLNNQLPYPTDDQAAKDPSSVRARLMTAYGVVATEMWVSILGVLSYASADRHQPSTQMFALGRPFAASKVTIMNITKMMSRLPDTVEYLTGYPFTLEPYRHHRNSQSLARWEILLLMMKAGDFLRTTVATLNVEDTISTAQALLHSIDALQHNLSRDLAYKVPLLTPIFDLQ